MQTGWGLVHHKLAACLSLVQLHEKAPCGHMVLYHFKSNDLFFSCRFFFLLQIMLKALLGFFWRILFQLWNKAIIFIPFFI